MAASGRATRGGRVFRLAAVSLSSRTRARRIARSSGSCAGSQVLMESRISSCLIHEEKAPRPASERLICQILFYFPFFGPFFSSFLAFFFIRISSSRSGHDGRCRQPLALDLIYGRSAEESRQFALKKTGLSRCGPCVVTLAGQDGKPFAHYPDLDSMVFHAAVRSARRIRQRVLVAGLFRNPGIQPLHRPALQTIVDIAARVMSVFGKPFEPPLEKSAAHANSVNRDIVAK